MRTNIVLNDELVAEARKYATAKTKTGIVEEALRAFVEARAAERRRETYEQRLAHVRETARRTRLRESSTTLVRRDRERG